MGRDSKSTSLAPGFRFHPTDEELVRYYLKRKVLNQPLRFDAISVIDIYKSEPWDLPDKSRLKSRDLEWYFFSMLDKKYGNGSRTNRATEEGYWKTTGKDRPVHHNSKAVGMKKTLVYHRGRAPRGERTNWVMHEYRLTDKELEKAGVVQDAFVLCRIFQKSGSGPKNGEQYGAPFIEEEWEDDEAVEAVFMPGQEMLADEIVVGDDAYVETNDLDQNHEVGIQSENASFPLNFYYGDSSNNAERSRDLSDNDQKPIIGMDETQIGRELQVERNFSDLPEQYEINARSVRNDYIVEPINNVQSGDVNYLLGDPYLDANDNPAFSDGLYLEANDLSNTIEPDSGGFDMVDEYLNFFDANDDNSEYLTFDASEILGSDNVISDQAPFVPEVNGVTEQESSQHLSEAHGKDEASSSNPKPEITKFESDAKYPFLKKASQMLGGIPAPPAFASEVPSKDVALRLHSVAQSSSSSVHVTAGMIRIRNMTLSGTGMEWSFGKNGDVNIVFSFDLSQREVSPANSVPLATSLSGKTGSLVSRSLFFLMCFWVVILSVSFKMGSYIYSK